MNFKELFKYYRQRQKINKTALANLLGKSEGYIRKLENDGYTPPTHALCQKIAKVLSLNKEEENLFYKHAFLERVKNDMPFYKHIKENEEKFLRQEKIEVPDNQIYSDKESISKCTYLFIWETKGKKNLLKNQIKETLERNIQETLSEFGHILQSLKIQANKVELIVDLSPSTNVQDFIKGLKSFTSGILKNKYKELTNIPSIWANNYAVFTIGNAPNRDYVDTIQWENDQEHLSELKIFK